MSIKYLQDQQLNQVQQSPNNSPWAKLVAQSEMLERNKMRQPQGQAPQGTVAGNIQQQLIDAQMKQERETQNADLYKSQMLAQLIGSGQIPANFAAQGYASGGLTQPGTGTYAGIMVPNQQPATSARMPNYVPPNSQDPNAQEKKHGMLQSLLDNSIVGMAQGKANIGNAMQDYADLFSGKIFSRGFAEGGDIRGFVEGGSLFGYDPNLNSSGLDPRLLEAQDAKNVARLRATEMVRKMHLGDAANRGVLSQLERETHPMVKRLMEQEAQNANNLKATEMGRQMQLGDVTNRNVIPNVPPSMTEQMSAAAKQNPLDTMWAKMSEADRLNAMHRASVQPKTVPSPSMTEGMSAAAKSPPRIDTMASRMAAADKANDIKLGDPMAPGATTFEEMAAKAKQGLGSLGEAASAVGRPIAKIAGALSPIGDLAMANKFTGGSNALLAQALSGQTPSSTMQGDMPEVAKDLMAVPSLPDWAKNIGSAINSKVSGTQDSAQPDAWTGGATTPQIPPQTATAQTPSASPTQGTIYKENGVTRPKNSVTVTPDKKIDLDVMNNAHKQPDVPTNQVSEAAQKAAAAQQAISAIERRPNEEGQGSILDSLYSKLKDSDVDYSDLAKRISQNEYDLARERKDGTLNAILGGVGAALSKAGSYEGVGDRVFRPGLGAIAGAGIMGGLKMSAASDEAIDKKSQDNMVAALALKKLKRESMNDVLDAISAQKQTDVYAQSVANTALSHRDTAANNAMKNAIDYQQLGINRQMALKNMEHLDAQIADLYNKASSDPNMQNKVNLAADKAKTAKDVLTSLTNGMVQPSDPRYIKAMTNFDAAFADLNSLGIALKIPTTVVPNAGSQTPQTTEEWAQQGYTKR